MKAIVVTDEAARTAGMTLVERTDPRQPSFSASSMMIPAGPRT
jgi:hypothetical protein